VAHLLDRLTADEFERVATYAGNQQQQQHVQRNHQDQQDRLRSGHLGPHWPADGELTTEELPSASSEDVIRVLATTAFTTEQVAAGLALGDGEVDQLRRDRKLWAIQLRRSWRFPTVQFDVDTMARRPIRQVRGLAQVLVALPEDLHPVAVDRFLRTPQPDLWNDGALSPLAWLRGGGNIEAAVHAAQIVDWYSR